MTLIHEPYDNFKGGLRSHQLTYKDVGEALGLSIATVSAKINGKSDFTLSEIRLLENRFGVPRDVFCGLSVA